MKKLEILADKNPLFGKCPSCNKLGTMHKSRTRNFKEGLIKQFTFWNVYRCKSCGWRGYRSTLSFTSKSLINLAYYAVIILVVAYVILTILKKSEWNL